MKHAWHSEIGVLEFIHNYRLFVEQSLCKIQNVPQILYRFLEPLFSVKNIFESDSYIEVCSAAVTVLVTVLPTFKASLQLYQRQSQPLSEDECTRIPRTQQSHIIKALSAH